MKQELSPRAFLLRFVALALALLLVGGGVMIAVDPYQHYRKSETHVLYERYSLPGMVEFSEYDAALVGSSMSQNFDMDQMDALFSCECFKATKGGLTPGEAAEILTWLKKEGKAKTVFLSLEITHFAGGEPEDKYFPDYLANDSLLDDWKYLYGYEAWMRFLPLNAAFSALDAVGKLPSSLAEKTEPDLLGSWAEDARYPGEEALVNGYLRGALGVSAQNADGMLSRMKENFDAWLAAEPFDPETEYVYFSAPYSALYWTHTMREGTLDAILQFRTYFFSRLAEYENVKVFDFQGIEEITDLDLYKDISHYHPDVNAYMLTLLSEEKHLAIPEEVEANNAFIRASVASLCERYPDLKK